MLREVTVKGNNYSYNIYKRRKPNGKYRIITAPDENLKVIQRDFSKAFYELTEDHYSSEITGFRPGISIKDNAKLHISKDWVINIDIKNFFPSTTSELVKWALKHSGLTSFQDFNLDELTELLTIEGRLPQGSPASPVLANYIAMYYVDPLVKQEANSVLGRTRYLYTRYADDITISFNNEYKNFKRSELKELTQRVRQTIIDETVYSIAPGKTSIAYKSQRQKVTGIIVNEKFSINKEERMKLRAELHHVRLGKKEISPNLLGRLSFVKQINKELYKKLTKDLTYESNISFHEAS